MNPPNHHFEQKKKGFIKIKNGHATRLKGGFALMTTDPNEESNPPMLEKYPVIGKCV